MAVSSPSPNQALDLQHAVGPRPAADLPPAGGPRAPGRYPGPLAVWALLGLVSLLPLAAALDPSGSTEPGSEAYGRASVAVSASPSAASRTASPAPALPTSRPTVPAAQAGQAVNSQEAAPVSTAAGTEKRTDIADSAQLSPDGSSSLDAGGAPTTALADSAAPSAARKEPLRLTPARPGLASPTQQPRWHLLSEVQRNLLAPFEEQWSELSNREKQALANMAQRFPEVSADDQERSMKRLAEWAELTPEDRRLARYNYRWMQQLDRTEVLAAWEQYQSLTPQQRAVLAAVGRTSNTAATHPGRRTGLAAEAAQPLPRRVPPVPEIPDL
jgi:hypothetical protein